MKKTLLALLLPGLVATSVNAVEVYKDENHSVNLYGRAYAGQDFSSDDTGTDANYGTDSYVRIGAKLKSGISDSMSAFARYELQWETDDGESQTKTKTRLAYAGVQSEVGAFSFGRQYGAVDLIADMTDTAYTNAYGEEGLGTGKNKEGTGRDSSMLKYSHEMGGLQVDASYLFDNVQDEDNDSNAFGLAVAYELDFGLTVGGGYNSSTPVGDYDARLFLVGAKYKTGPVSLAATYASGSEFLAQDTDHTGYEISAEYKFTKQIRAHVFYNAQETEVGSVTTDTADDLVFGARYDFNKFLRTVAEYRINGLDNKDDDFQIALRYDF